MRGGGWGARSCRSTGGTRRRTSSGRPSRSTGGNGPPPGLLARLPRARARRRGDGPRGPRRRRETSRRNGRRRAAGRPGRVPSTSGEHAGPAGPAARGPGGRGRAGLRRRPGIRGGRRAPLLRDRHPLPEQVLAAADEAERSGHLKSARMLLGFASALAMVGDAPAARAMAERARAAPDWERPRPSSGRATTRCSPGGRGGWRTRRPGSAPTRRMLTSRSATAAYTTSEPSSSARAGTPRASPRSRRPGRSAGSGARVIRTPGSIPGAPAPRRRLRASRGATEGAGAGHQAPPDVAARRSGPASSRRGEGLEEAARTEDGSRHAAEVAPLLEAAAAELGPDGARAPGAPTATSSGRPRSVRHRLPGDDRRAADGPPELLASTSTKVATTPPTPAPARRRRPSPSDRPPRRTSAAPPRAARARGRT